MGFSCWRWARARPARRISSRSSTCRPRPGARRRHRRRGRSAPPRRARHRAGRGRRSATTTAVDARQWHVVQAQPAQSVTLKLAPSIATEAAWLYRDGWPLYALVDRYATGAPLDAEIELPCHRGLFRGARRIARRPARRRPGGHEPRRFGPLSAELVRDGQAAGAILLRPPRPVPADRLRLATRGARREAIARLAAANVVPSMSTDVLWYHADYVAPSWGRRLTVVEQDRRAHLLSRVSAFTVEARRPSGALFGRLLRFGAAPTRLGVNRVHGGFARESIRASMQVSDFPAGISAIRGGSRVLRILVVEDDSQLAATLKYLVEDNPRYRVVGDRRRRRQRACRGRGA